MTDDSYEIYAIKYARLSRRSPDNFIGGDPHDTDMPLNYYVWVIYGRKTRLDFVTYGYFECFFARIERLNT